MENSDKLKIAKRMIIIMLCILMFCYTAFLVAPDLFRITLTKDMIKIDKFMLDNKWAVLITSSITMYIHLSLFYLAVFQKWKLNWYYFIGLIPFVLLINVLTIYIQWTKQGFAILCLTLDILSYIVLPIIIGKFIFKEKLETITIKATIGYLLFLGYTVLSFMIKDIHQVNGLRNAMINIILLIDVYIVQSIAYFYMNLLKEVKHGRINETICRQEESNNRSENKQNN